MYLKTQVYWILITKLNGPSIEKRILVQDLFLFKINSDFYSGE